MATRFVIFIKADTDSSGFKWELRELISEATGTAAERSGPTLISGTAPDSATAKHDAEVQAERFALEDVYIYNTTTQEPTPLPSP